MDNKNTPGVWGVSPTHGAWFNQELMKDCGMIPYMLHRVYGFRPTMLGRKSGEYPYLKLMPGMRMEFLPVSEYEYHGAKIRFLQSHFEEMDMLVLYGPYYPYSDFLREYRKLRPDGKVYMSLDMNSIWAAGIAWTDHWFIEMLDSCDVVATSCRKVQEHLNRSWGRWPIHYIPNGFYNLTGQPVNATPQQKENILLTVGRIGTEQKANHVLLEAFAAVHTEIPDWQVHLVGRIDDAFLPYIDQYFARYPQLRDKVFFKGLIEDKAELYAQYARAKIFALTSVLEGAPNVAAEALFHGCYTVISAIDAAGDITNDGLCGREFPIGDVGALAAILKEICPDDALFRDTFPKTIAYANDCFDWEKIIKRLHGLLYGE
ncbi:MAG: glycosyltransferase family 4 protein [Oscillospiraceae bacterium]|jgi:glycosyltransferase involved in cell wall biosynthesis|nr:glycosyltransferase family 4 protein [Oscillospiraceae bacterium]